jgi:polysaccharide export outer membrane protein
MQFHGSVAALTILFVASGPLAVRAADSPSYAIECPDVLRIVVSGLGEEGHLIQGEHLVRPDGTVGFGPYGSVSVTGLTIDRARKAIVNHLASSAKKDKLEAQIEVSEYNSKCFYIISRNQDGEQLRRLPATGSETVVSVVLQFENLAASAFKGGVWVCNPSSDKVRKVDWRAITQKGKSDTNYRLEAHDRLYVGESPPK